MSTASRNCGTVCSARGLRSNAPEAPGVSGKIRGHYDPRAARQLGGLRKTEPKYEPEAETAAHASQSSAHNKTFFRRGARLRHSPPLSLPQPPPKRRRKHMTNHHRRIPPLAACPNLTCRRAGICHHLAQNGNCLKTSFATHDDWCDYMADKIRKFHASCNFPPRDPNLPELSESEALAIVYKAFQERVAEHRAEQVADRRNDVH